MEQLASYASDLDNIRFYAQNMLNVQFGSPLQLCPYTHRVYIRHGSLQRLIATIERDFDNAISRGDLAFPSEPLIYKFRAALDRYRASYFYTQLQPCLPSLGYDLKVPERGNKSAREFACLFLDYAAEQVRSFIYLLSIECYAKQTDDSVLPLCPQRFEVPHVFECLQMQDAHANVARSMLEALLLSYRDGENSHNPILREYGRDVILPLVAEARNVIYAAYPEVRGE